MVLVCRRLPVSATWRTALPCVNLSLITGREKLNNGVSSMSSPLECVLFHFFPRFARDVHTSPFAMELRRLQVPHRLFAEELNRHYSTRAGLLLRVYPMLLICAGRAAIRSLVLSRPKPDAVIVTSDIEALVFGLLRAVFSRRTRIVFETFIATERGSPLARWLHHVHYSLVLRFVDVAICHSEFESGSYAAKFLHCGTRFAALPYALSVNGRERLRQQFEAEAAASNLIVTAGRSGRDYATLAQAIEGLPCRLRIICDWERPTRGLESGQVEVLRSCFKTDYLEELARARMIVVPLSQQNVSAGQMVLLQGFALGKPVVITETATTREYAAHGQDALFARSGDVADLRRQIEALLADPALCRTLGEQAASRYDERFSIEAYVARLTQLLQELGSNRRLPARAAAPQNTAPAGLNVAQASRVSG